MYVYFRAVIVQLRDTGPPFYAPKETRALCRLALSFGRKRITELTWARGEMWLHTSYLSKPDSLQDS